MSLTIGSRIGNFEIVGKLGEGGMGEVYRARDSRLDRDVAIKVLPASFALDPDRDARFTREAKTLAALNHPNIAALYGVEDHDGRRALVMELVEGEDLSAMISRSPLSLSEALPLLRQIADALEAAHEQGIIHRDLKPANIKVRPDGTVKVLDFGLAKALDASASGATADAMNSPTLTARATALGTIMGTAAYMAPEQAKGKAVDRRADIWAFGAIVYETLSGRRAFKGDDVSETLAAVLRDTPSLDVLPASTPKRIRELIARCLTKDPRARQRDIGDVRLELAAIETGPAEAIAAAAPRSSPLLLAGVAAITLALGLAAGWWMHRVPASSATGLAAKILVSPNTPTDLRSPALTPDGRTLVFEGDGQLYLRSFDSFETVAIAGTSGGSLPMISPDGTSLAFFADRKLKRVPMAGGDPVVVATVDSTISNIPGACWCTDDLVLYTRAWVGGLSSISMSNGTVKSLTTPDASKGERGHWRPQPMPGGKRVIFSIMRAGTGVNDSRIAVLDLATATYQVLFPGTDGAYLSSGHVLYFHGGSWHLVPFDADTMKTTGSPVTVLPDAYGVQPDGGSSGTAVSVSPAGVLAYLPGPMYDRRELAWIDRSGALEPLGVPPRAMEHVALSPDGKRLAVSRFEGGTFDLWVIDLARRTEDHVDVKGLNLDPVWDPTSSWLAFVSERKGDYDAYIARPDGSGERVLLNRDYDEGPKAWSHDGKRIILKQWLPDGTTPIVAVNAATGGDPDVLMQGAVAGVRLMFSPDDRWLVYTAFAQGVPEVYVRASAQNASAVRVSSTGGTQPAWSPDGTEIYFRKDRALMSAPFRASGARAEVGVPKQIVTLPESTEFYDVARDGKRFLVGRSIEPRQAPGVRVVLNWFSTLKGASGNR